MKPLSMSKNQLVVLLNVAIFGILLLASYWSVFVWMYGRFVGPDSYYSHGFLIPLVSAFFIWRKRDTLKKVHIEMSPWGLVVILLAALLHIAGTILYIFSVSGFALYLFIVGATLFLFGRHVFRCILFPLAFMAFMFPIPEAFITILSFPLKMLVAEMGVRLVAILGIPVFREGFQITIPAGQLLVGNPCSGLRSIIAFMAISSIFAYLSNISLTRKMILFLSAIPVALISNMIRVPALILISHYRGLEAAKPGTFWHDASGVLVFALGLVLLFLVGELLQWKDSEPDS